MVESYESHDGSAVMRRSDKDCVWILPSEYLSLTLLLACYA
jgi:hypothetical protein